MFSRIRNGCLVFSRILEYFKRKLKPDISCLTHSSSQIPRLAEIYYKHFGLRRNATFVEVGAFDGESWSNTCSLADYGWSGLYIEPIHKYAQLCRRRHSKNKVHVAEYAVGSRECTVDIYIGGAFTTCRGGLPDLYNSIEWTGGAHIDKELIQVRQRKLDDILFENGIKPNFELLVVDVEGSELEVFHGFSIDFWRPKLLIVEIEDEHPDFQGLDQASTDFRINSARCRSLIEKTNLYIEVYRDAINTVFSLKA